MKQITVAVLLMCAVSAYASYPSVTGRGETLAMSMQESRSLPIEAYDAV